MLSGMALFNPHQKINKNSKKQNKTKTKQNKTKNKQTNYKKKREKKKKKDNPSRRNQPCNNLQKEERKKPTPLNT
jgi:hypothetical protein